MSLRLNQVLALIVSATVLNGAVVPSLDLAPALERDRIGGRLNNTTLEDNLVVGEPRPDNFYVFPYYPPGGVALPQYDTWIAILYCMGELVKMKWDADLSRLNCALIPNVDIILSGSRASGATFQTRHAIWSLISMPYWWEKIKDAHIAESSWSTRLNGVQIGIGQVKAKNHRSTSPTRNYPEWDRRLRLRAHFHKNTPAACSPYEFFRMLMFFLEEIGEADVDGAFQGLRRHFPPHDVTLYLGPTSVAAGREGTITNLMAIVAIVALGQWMATAPHDQRFHEFEGVINWRGPIVGNIGMYKGRVQ